MLKKITGLTIAALLVSGMMTIGTWAFFSDFETASNNVMTAGTLDLKTNDADGVSQTLFATNMRPGDTIGPEYIVLKNSGTVAASSSAMAFTYTENDAATNPVNKTADETAAMIEVVTLNYGGSSVLGSVTDTNVNGYRDIQDLKNTTFSGLTGIAAGDTKNFEIVIRPRSSTAKEFQADGITITMNFTLNQ